MDVPFASKVSITDDALEAELSDGRTIIVPILWYPRLAYASADERGNYELIGDGYGIHWPDLDEDISVENLLRGQKSSESQESLRRWLQERQIASVKEL
jgi:hypothetical protein